MKGTFKNDVTTEVCEIHIPVCESCNKEYELKLTTIDPETQMGFGEFLPSCNCTI